MMSNFERLHELYQSGSVPWDQPLPPPEVLEIAKTLPPGQGLDLGCGLGRASLHLAGLGWRMDGVDFVPEAVQEATRRAADAGLADRITFHRASVADLGFLSPEYDFALDVGCAHGLSAQELRAYHGGLLRLLRPGAVYLLFAHLTDENPAHPPDQATPDDAQRRRWVRDEDLRALFSQGFVLDEVIYGQTQVNDQEPWRSAWYWFRRAGEEG